MANKRVSFGWLSVMGRIVALTLASSLLLSACGGGYDPAAIKPRYKIRNSPIPIPLPMAKPPLKAVQSTSRRLAGNRHTVVRGDTLYSLGRRYGVATRALIEANGLRAPYTLRVGQVLRFPAPGVHVVKRGETTYGISRQYGASLQDLVRVNGLRPPYRLAVGQKLTLPNGSARQVASNRTTTSRPNTTRRSGPGRVTTRPPARQGSRFAWPTDGQIISRFGPKEGGIHNDGINILAKQGAPVRVADAGVVVYAADDLEGYGNLVLVRHQGGWVTAYAHNDSLSVKEGDTVKRGQLIARVGRTGGVPQPQLHFEIRKGRQALDPLRYLAARNAEAHAKGFGP